MNVKTGQKVSKAAKFSTLGGVFMRKCKNLGLFTRLSVKT